MPVLTPEKKSQRSPRRGRNRLFRRDEYGRRVFRYALPKLVRFLVFLAAVLAVTLLAARILLR